MEIVKKIRSEFLATFDQSPVIFFSPGRINLIGEFTDFNNGFVLPAAISKGITFAFSENDDQSCNFYASDLQESFSFELNDDLEISKDTWKNYIIGVVSQLRNHGLKRGFNCLFGGTIPVGSGLSSSAALSCGLGFGLVSLFDLTVSKTEITRIAQKAEHDFVGVKCGIMDQYACTFGKENQLMRLDCRDLNTEFFPISLQNHALVLFDTKVKHSLASSAYNTRRTECEDGVKVMQANNNHINSLRDAKMEDLNAVEDQLDHSVFQRCKHVIDENNRVLDTCQALSENDINKVGSLLFESHDSLKNKFEVSCEELDVLVQAASEDDKIIGSRMMGGGFGGCTINIVEKDEVDNVYEKMKHLYKEKTGKSLGIIRVDIADGVRQVS